ncbi:MAG TPA: PAS domain S-box protein [Bryobacteraceae bacterium]|nr:PAS domain S-box protein [Bryobacteraceae bacterium]
MTDSKLRIILAWAAGVVPPALSFLVAAHYEALVHPMLGIPFFAAVIFALWAGGRGPGLLAAGLSACGLAYLLTAGSHFSTTSVVHVAAFAFVALLLVRRTTALEDTKTLLFRTLSSLGDAVLATDPRGTTIFANPLAAELLGKTPAEVKGRRMRDLWPELAEAGTTEVARNERSFELFAARIPHYGQLYALREVTGRKKAEERRALLENLIANMRDGFHIVDMQTGEILMANRAMDEMAGYAPGQLAGKHISVLFEDAEGGVPPDFDVFQEQLRRDGSWQGEVATRRQDGSQLITLTTITCLDAGSGQWTATVNTDITARRRAQEELRLSEQRFRSLVASLHDVVFTLDTNQRNTGVFGGWFAERGVSAERLLGRTAREVFGPEQAEAHEQANRRALAGEDAEYEWCADGPNGNVWFQTSLSPLRDASGAVNGIVGVARDITEHKNLEERLRQAQKMDAIGRLAGGMAHDFNNLLTVINGYSQMMLDDLDPHSPAQDYAREVLEAGNRAALLIGRLLAFSGRQIIQPEVLDINSVVTRLDPALRRFLGAATTLRTALDPRLGRVRADPSQIEHILMDLASNAHYAMPAGGTLTIGTANVEVGSEAGREAAPGPYVMIAIRDTGTGMSSEAMEHLFEPFYSSKGVGKGTGLGLSSVYGIARQNRGDVQVESEPGRGTEVRVYLPRVTDTAVPKPLPQREPDRGTETILLVENDAGVRAFTSQVLGRYGYQVLQASNGSEALAIAEDPSRGIDLLLSDVLMPLMSGQELARRLAAGRPGIKAVYMNAHSDAAIAYLGLDLDVPLVPKPFDPATLARTIREVLDSTERPE